MAYWIEVNRTDIDWDISEKMGLEWDSPAEWDLYRFGWYRYYYKDLYYKNIIKIQLTINYLKT
jgi:hypothetical protein